MKPQGRIVCILAAGLALAACAGQAPAGTGGPSIEPPTAVCPDPPPTVCPEPPAEPVCDPADTTAADAPRQRGWVLFQVSDPVAAAQQVMEAMADDGKDGNDFVVVRADVVEGEASYNLVVPVDAAEGQLEGVVERLMGLPGMDGSEAPTVLGVVASFPEVPHSASTFITPDEYRRDPLPEYCPPGRHPNSPGANPWG